MVNKAPFTNERITLNRSAHQKLSTLKPGTKRATRRIKRALITKPKTTTKELRMVNYPKPIFSLFAPLLCLPFAQGDDK
jgi:hypothetical protein